MVDNLLLSQKVVCAVEIVEFRIPLDARFCVGPAVEPKSTKHAMIYFGYHAAMALRCLVIYAWLESQNNRPFCS